MVDARDLKSLGKSVPVRVRPPVPGVRMILIYDDLMPELASVDKYYTDKSSLEQKLIADYKLDQVLTKLWNLASKHYDLSNVVVTESWAHNEHTVQYLNWHVDDDVEYRRFTGISLFPQCTMLYYPLVDESIMGGRFCIGSDRIEARTNRAIIFDSNLKHTVEPLRGGRRVSVVYNPWNHQVKKHLRTPL